MSTPARHGRLLVAALLWLPPPEPPAPSDPLAPDDPDRTFLTTADPLLRERARRILVGRGDTARPTLLAALDAADPRLRESAALSLADLDGDDIEARLARLLDDPDPAVRIAALRILAVRGTQTLLPGVTASARRSSWAERRAAALALSRTEVDAAIPLLVDLTRDADPDVARAAANGLLHSRTAAARQALRESLLDAATAEQPSALTRLRAEHDDGDAAFFHAIAGQARTERQWIVATAALAERGERPVRGDQVERIVRAAASSDPHLRRPAVATLVRDRSAAIPAVHGALLQAEAGSAESLAELLVGMAGPDSHPLLLEIAQGRIQATPIARAAAVHALRRFRTAATNTELMWIYSPELPRPMREELVAAFEDLPRSDSARSGLVDALLDPDSSLRLRAFRVLLQYGASTELEIDWFWQRVLDEKVGHVRQRMCRLLASHARGEGARRFATQMVTLLAAEEPHRSDARDALENLTDPELQRAVAREVLDNFGDRLDFPLLRLLTRLEGDEADQAVSRAFRTAVEQGDREQIRNLLIALRAGGGADAAAAALDSIEAVGAIDAALGTEILRTLLLRGDARAALLLHERYARLGSSERGEFIDLLPKGDFEQQARWFRDFLLLEEDDVTREGLITRAGELRLPIADALVPWLRADKTAEFRIRVADALSWIGGEVAADELVASFGNQLERFENGSDDAENRLLLESLARAAARTGRVDLAPPLAELLFSGAAEHEHRVADTDATFPFEVTLMMALLDLAGSSRQPVEVAAVIEVELDRLAGTGELYLLPKALFEKLGQALHEAPRAFRALSVELLDLVLRLPPTGDRRELRAALQLARRATRERDHLRAERLLQHARLLIDYHGVEGDRVLRDHYDQPNPLDGFDPRLRLLADLELSRARLLRTTGEDDEAIDQYRRALDRAPFDAWLWLRVAGELMEQDLDRAGARQHALTAAEFAPHDPSLQVRAARILAAVGDEEGFRACRSTYEALRACGLMPDRVTERLGLAEGWVLLDQKLEAYAEIEAAFALDEEARRRVENNPLLAPLLR